MRWTPNPIRSCHRSRRGDKEGGGYQEHEHRHDRCDHPDLWLEIADDNADGCQPFDDADEHRRSLFTKKGVGPADEWTMVDKRRDALCFRGRELQEAYPE